MRKVKYDNGQMAQESAFPFNVSAEKARWGLPLGRLGYVLAVNAGLTTVSFMLIVLSYL